MTRAWILGNGPSLSPEHLSLLKDEVTFACGRIHLMYKATDWRPTHYVLSEKLNKIDEHRLRRDFRELVYEYTTFHIQWGLCGIFSTGLQARCKDTEFFVTCQHGVDDEPPLTWHLPEICHYGSSLHAAMQIAHREGYSPLYLLGCDLTGGHFTDYGNDAVDTEIWRRAHEIAWNSKVIIYNATIGGNLEVYPRVDIMEVL